MDSILLGHGRRCGNYMAGDAMNNRITLHVVSLIVGVLIGAAVVGGAVGMHIRHHLAVCEITHPSCEACR
jgi:hypothetical protein